MKCVIFNNIEENSEPIESSLCACTARDRARAYSSRWYGQSFSFCYLKGGLSAATCAGAKKSKKFDLYYTTDADICKAAEDKRGKTRNISNVSFNNIFRKVMIIL